MNRPSVLVPVMFGILSFSAAFAAVEQQATKPAATQQVSPAARPPATSKLPMPFGIQPAALLLGTLLAGTVLVLVSGTGRETLNSINFERAYREEHKPPSQPAGH